MVSQLDIKKYILQKLTLENRQIRVKVKVTWYYHFNNPKGMLCEFS